MNISLNNQYTEMQKLQYMQGTNNHEIHNDNPNYWDILLSDIKNSDSWDGKIALDFACGRGRNVTNLHSLRKWNRVDGIDISPANIEYCKLMYISQKSSWYCNNGIDVAELKSNEYDFVMSMIALQHIPVYDIRKSILTDLLRVLKPGGLFSFQLGYGKDLIDSMNRPRSAYFDNAYTAQGTNSQHDVRVQDEQVLVQDLQDIGYTNITYEIHESFSDYGHPQWIYVKCYKPTQS